MSTDHLAYFPAIKFLILKIDEKHKQYGLSYKEMTLDDLYLRFREQVKQLDDVMRDRTTGTNLQFRLIKDCSLDVALMSLLLFEEVNRRTRRPEH